ncbi:MAG: TniB family NTP-binding protein [Sphingomonas sp.]
MTNGTYTNHKLRPEMKEFLDIDGRDRLYACWDRIWIPTPSSEEAFLALQDCMKAAPSTKPRGLIITGDADTGKSRTMTAFRDKHLPKVNPNTEYAEHPVIYITAPNKPSETAVLKKILDELGHPLLYNASDENLRAHTIRMLKSCAVGTVMIDEIGDIQRDYVSSRVVEFLRFLKGLINETGRPFVVGGTLLILDLIGGEEQIAGRLNTVVRLKPFTLTEFVKILLAFERMLPLRATSDFRADEAMIRTTFELSGGYIGRLSNLLHDACQVAIGEGSERITLSTIERVKNRSIDTVGRRVV